MWLEGQRIPCLGVRRRLGILSPSSQFPEAQPRPRKVLRKVWRRPESPGGAPPRHAEHAGTGSSQRHRGNWRPVSSDYESRRALSPAAGGGPGCLWQQQVSPSELLEAPRNWWGGGGGRAEHYLRPAEAVAGQRSNRRRHAGPQFGKTLRELRSQSGKGTESQGDVDGRKRPET